VRCYYRYVIVARGTKKWLLVFENGKTTPRTRVLTREKRATRVRTWVTAIILKGYVSYPGNPSILAKKNQRELPGYTRQVWSNPGILASSKQ
jgi:hypothetical protein